MKKMTENQAKLLYFIFKYRGQYGTAPTLREMVRELGVSDNKSVLGIIEALAKQGYLQREKKKSRSVLLTDNAQKFLNEYLLPFQYQSGPTAADQLRQPAELARTDVAVLSPTSESLSYKESAIKTNGTNLGNDLRAVVGNTVASIANKVYAHEETGIIFGWALLFGGLTWANINFIGNGTTALVWTAVETVMIRILSKKITL